MYKINNFTIYKNLLFTFLLLLGLHRSASAQNEIQIQHGPYLQNVGENEVTVLWVTSTDAMSWVEIAPDDGSHFYADERPQYFQTENGRKLVGKLHQITIKGLEKGTTYRYRIYSRQVFDHLHWDTSFGKVAASNPYRTFSFTTLDQDKPEFSFTVVNDIHEDPEALEDLLSHVDLEKRDFVVYNGDMMTHINSEEHMFKGFMDKTVELFASHKPFYYARGNHETRGPFSTRFMNYFPTPSGKPYFTFRQGPVFFLFLDGGEDKPDSDIEYGGLSAFDEFREEQAKWLEKVVESEEFKNAPQKVAIIHIPPYTSTWHGTLEVERLFAPILNEAGIDLMISGHTHRHGFIPAGEKGNQFPILINGNREVVDVQVLSSGLEIQIKDRDGNLKHEFEF